MPQMNSGTAQPGPAAQPAQLVVLEPDTYRGRRIPLFKDELVVGREAHCDVRFDDPYLSRAHAVVRRRGGTIYVHDLNSRAGTLVNGATATGDRPLCPGDIVVLADVKLRYEPAVAGPAGADTAYFDVGDQPTEIINNIGCAEYVAYIEQREGFLREVAATRTKARWLVWIGLLMFVAGFALFAAGSMDLIRQVIDGPENGGQQPDDSFGAAIPSTPAELLSWTLAAVGALLLLVGIVMHIVATSRRRRVDRELPALPPWVAALRRAR